MKRFPDRISIGRGSTPPYGFNNVIFDNPFVGADDSVRPDDNHSTTLGADRVVRPYRVLAYHTVGRAPRDPPYNQLSYCNRFAPVGKT